MEALVLVAVALVLLDRAFNPVNDWGSIDSITAVASHHRRGAVRGLHPAVRAVAGSTQRYAELLTSRRFTPSDAFGKAGWHTVSDDPCDDIFWPHGRSFYHYAPSSSGSSSPPGRKPVMAEIDLVSSHIPHARQ